MRESRRRLNSTDRDDPSLASYGMGSTYASSSYPDLSVVPDNVSVEVSDIYDDPLSLKPKANKRPPAPVPPRRMMMERRPSGNRVSFRADTKDKTKPKGPMKKRHNPPLPEPKRDDPGSGKYWHCLSWFSTFYVPDFLICRPDAQGKQAWREKVTIFNIFIAANMIFLFFFGVIPLYFCRIEDNPLAQYEWYQAGIDEACDVMEYASYFVIFTVAALLALQCLCSIILGCRSFQFRMSDDRPFEPRDFKSPVMVMVPCYNEGEKELRKTINSIIDSNYPEEHKILMVVADGIITGRGEYFNTPATLARLLGFSLDSKRDKAYAYKSLGGSGENRASIYSGVMERNGKYLKYIVVVKRGTPAEKESPKPGNRGKRDSQLISLGLLNRVHHDRKKSDLDKAICEACKDLGMPVEDWEYMLAIDADTRISLGSISHMVYNMNLKRSVLACCGETKVDNKTSSWVTMIQVYEYFASHHLKKSFESIFGTVTCLPGCFTMYRITADDDRALISSDAIFQQYARNDIESLHEKNLYHLGEDRMLTTLLLRFFPDMSLAFVPIAACWTIVPDEFKVLLSQRRRWINSTFHNMWELLKVNTMCGFCCISMNTIVIFDIFCTLILPSSIIYAVGYIYTSIVDQQGLSSITLGLYATLIGAQVLIFLIRSRFDYILWFMIYMIMGVPVFYFILPIYSFWHMDDFSWGTTRQVAGSKNGTGNSNGKDAPHKPAAALAPAPSVPKPKPPVPPPEEPPREARRERRPSLGEEHRTKLQAMGAGQLPQSRSWEDGYRTTSSHGSSSSGSHNKGPGRAYLNSKYSTTDNNVRNASRPVAAANSGPVDLDEISDIEMQSPITSAAAVKRMTDPPAFQAYSDDLFDSDVDLDKDELSFDDDEEGADAAGRIVI